MPLDPDALESLRKHGDAGPSRSASRRWPWWLAGVTVVLAALLLFVVRGKAVEVRTFTAQGVQSASQGAVLNASGYVVARRQATVAAKVTGKVIEVRVEEGMSVKEGDLLARLDESSVRPQYLLAQRQLDAAHRNLNEVQVRLADARKNLGRIARLRDQKLVSEQQFDTATADSNALDANLEALKAQVAVAEAGVRARAQELADLQVRAPFNGVVISKDAQPGEMVSPISAGGGFTRTGIATIVDMDSREIEVDVNEAFINRVHPAQRTTAVLDAYPDWNIPSRVINIVPAADRQKATVKVRIAFDRLDPRILSDMGVKVTFLENEPRSPEAARVLSMISAAAIDSTGAHRYVWIVHDHRVERRAITIGAERNGQTEVLAGVRPGEILVAPAVSGLHDGDNVKIKE